MDDARPGRQRDDAAAKVQAAGGSVLAEPFDVLPAGRMVVLADPSGAVLCGWEAGIREGAQLVNEPAAWSMSLLRTAQLESAADFYGAVFGWQPEAFGPPDAQVTLCRLPGYVGGEAEQPVPRDVVAVMTPLAHEAGTQAQWNVDFWVKDADATAERAVQLGAQVVVGPHDTPGFRNAVLADPQGAAFSVSQLVLGGGPGE